MPAFCKIPYFPPFDCMTPEAAATDFPLLLTEAHVALDHLEETLVPTWQGLMRPLHECSLPLFDAWGLLCHMLSVMNNDAWREIQERLQPEIIAFAQRIGQSRKLYQGYQSLQKNHSDQPFLTPVQHRILIKTLQVAEQAGVGLTPQQQSRFNAIQTELAQLSTTFRNHVLDATKAFALTLHTHEEIAGLPPALLAVTAQAAQEASTSTTVTGDGPWRITLDSAVYLPFMMHSRNRAAREQLYRAHVTRAASGELDNTPLIERILTLRRELAHLLGYANYADLALVSKTAGTHAAVDHLITQLAEAAQKPAQQEAEDLLVFARENGFEGDRLCPWDITFWAERQREARYDYSDEALSRYFLFPRVLEGLFALAERLFNISITAADGEAPTWHPDVRFFRVSDKEGTPRACFYLDPYSRPATKSGGAWMNDFRSRDRRPDNTVTLPMALLVCNQSVPVGNEPPVMRFQEVTTLFHEFGHALQHMLTTVEEPAASGVNGIEWDAIEIASQFMENWCYDRDTLQGLSCHAETKETLPDALFDRLIAAKNFRAASDMMRQLFFAATDMALHAQYPCPEWPQANAVKCHYAALFSPTPLLPEDRFLCSFSHIFGGGYAAGYYSYKWSEVFSSDAFAAFEEAGLSNDAAIRATGQRFRETLLALGGGTEPGEVFRLFRGRDPDIHAILRHAGLNTTPQPSNPVFS